MSQKMSTSSILQILVALLLLTFGIAGLTDYNSTGSELMRSANKMFGGSNDIVPIILAVIQIVVGALLILEFFTPVPSKFVFIGMVIICVIWIISILTSFITNNFLEPNFIAWLAKISVELILLFSFWTVGSQKN